ncbi:MAG: MBL fold metallo-hydrolase [Alicyclobacillus sp.]|nr:MBL fold metallo-hydrolase [Alicyclobacillus sp.]
MNRESSIPVFRVSPHVVQLQIPTPTLPPHASSNTYIVHHGDQALWVDAGTVDTEVLEDARSALEDLDVHHIVALVATHQHRDHTHGLPYLQAKTGAPIFVHAQDLEGAVREMRQTPFAEPAVHPIPPGFQLGPVTVTVHHAPGHTRGHVHLVVQPDNVILVGDHLIGSGSVWIGPPDGHMGDYYRALDAICASGCRTAGPGHGPVLGDAAQAAQALKQRRLQREEDVFRAIQGGAETVEQVVDAVYGGTVPEEARWAARQTTVAHLLHLQETGRVVEDSASGQTVYRVRPDEVNR